MCCERAMRRRRNSRAPLEEAYASRTIMLLVQDPADSYFSFAPLPLCRQFLRLTLHVRSDSTFAIPQSAFIPSPLLRFSGAPLIFLVLGSRLSDHSALRIPDLIPRFPGSPFLQRALSPSLPVSPAPCSSLHRPRPFAEGAAGEAEAAVPDHGEQVVLDFPRLAPVGKTARQAGGEAKLAIDHLEQDGAAMLPTTKGITWRRWRGSNYARRRETEKPLPIRIGSLALGTSPGVW